MLCQRTGSALQCYSDNVNKLGGTVSPKLHEHHSQGTMVLVHEPGYYTGHRASAWSLQYNCRPRIPNNEAPVRLDVETQLQGLQQDPGPLEYMLLHLVCTFII